MDRTTRTRSLLIDPAAPRRSARERATVRWFTRDAGGDRPLIDEWAVKAAPVQLLLPVR